MIRKLRLGPGRFPTPALRSTQPKGSWTGIPYRVAPGYIWAPDRAGWLDTTETTWLRFSFHNSIWAFLTFHSIGFTSRLSAATGLMKPMQTRQPPRRLFFALGAVVTLGFLLFQFRGSQQWGASGAGGLMSDIHNSTLGVSRVPFHVDMSME